MTATSASDPQADPDPQPRPAGPPRELRDTSRTQPELPGSRGETSITFIHHCRDTLVGSWKDKLFFLALATYCKVLVSSDYGTCRLYLRTLCAAFEMHRSRVKEYLARLEKRGLVITNQTGRYLVIVVRSTPAVMRDERGAIGGPDGYSPRQTDGPVSGPSDGPVSGPSKEQDPNGDVPNVPRSGSLEGTRARGGRKRARSEAGAAGLDVERRTRSRTHEPDARSHVVAQSAAGERRRVEPADAMPASFEVVQASLRQLRNAAGIVERPAQTPASDVENVVENADSEPNAERRAAARELLARVDADEELHAVDEAAFWARAKTTHKPATVERARCCPACGRAGVGLTCGTCGSSCVSDDHVFQPDPDLRGSQL